MLHERHKDYDFIVSDVNFTNKLKHLTLMMMRTGDDNSSSFVIINNNVLKKWCKEIISCALLTSFYFIIYNCTRYEIFKNNGSQVESLLEICHTMVKIHVSLS